MDDGCGVPGCGGEDRRAQLVSSLRSLRPRGRDANVVREEIGSMGVHELDQVLANAAAAVDDSRRCATCSVQQRS